MNRPTKHRRLRAAEHRGALIAAATERFAAETYGGVRVQDIVADAGVSLTTFYKEFDDREDCLRACFLEMKQGLIDAVVGSAVEGMEPRERTRMLFEKLFSYLDEHEAPARLLLLDTIGGSKRTVAEMWLLLDELGAFVDGLNDIAVAEGAGRPIAVDGVGLFVAGGVYAVVARHLREHRMSELRKDDETIDAVVEALFSATAALTGR